MIFLLQEIDNPDQINRENPGTICTIFSLMMKYRG